MTIEQINAEFSKLPITEKLLLIEDMWDSVADGDHEIPLPEWQRRELDARYESFQQGNVELRESPAVHESIRGEYT